MANFESQDRYYTSAGDINGVLRSLQKERCGLNIQFEDAIAIYNSMVLDVNVKKGYFLLDEVTPRDGHRKMESGMSFSIRASLQGIRVHVRDLKIARTLNDSGGMYYEVPFPDKLLYLQRRDAFRALVPGSMMATIRFRSPEQGKDLHGRIVNMSATGVRVMFAGRITPEPDYLQKFDVQIMIQAQEQTLECSAEIIHVEYLKERDQTVFGCRFASLQRPAQMTINRFVTFLQREGMA